MEKNWNEKEATQIDIKLMPKIYPKKFHDFSMKHFLTRIESMDDYLKRIIKKRLNLLRFLNLTLMILKQ